MSKGSKKRLCPALSREITAADCGENRNSRYVCPADCPHNPLSVARYDDLLQAERALGARYCDWLRKEAVDRIALDRAAQREAQAESMLRFHAFMNWNLFFKRDAGGTTAAERLEHAAGAGLKNDERVLLRAQRQVRVALLEIWRVIDHERTEVVDLFDPGSDRIVLIDRGLAARATRFATFLGWVHPLPHFWRVSGVALPLPDMEPLTSVETVTELVRHLGGPVELPAMRLWLAEYVVRFHDALTATALARRDAMFAALDVHSGKAVYELQAPFADCRARLDESSAVDHDPLTQAERDEGFVEARAWFKDEGESLVAQVAGTRVLMGRVLLGQSHFRLETMGKARMASLREAFEQQLGGRVQFKGERLEDIRPWERSGDPSPDPSLVPPRLLQTTRRLAVESSRMPPLEPGRTLEDYKAELRLTQDRAFLDHGVEALGGLTPRAAATDPNQRPALVRLIKARIRAHDEEMLRSGRTDDINWLVRELGLHEILVDPPPARPPLEATDESEEEEDHGGPGNVIDDEDRVPAPALPELPFSQTMAEKLARRIDEEFGSVSDAVVELVLSRSTVIDDVEQLSLNALSREDFLFFVPFLLQAWFSLVPAGCWAPELDTGRMLASVESLLAERLNQTMDDPDGLERMMNQSRQPALSRVLAADLVTAWGEADKDTRPNPLSVYVMLLLLRSLVDELDLVLRA